MISARHAGLIVKSLLDDGPLTGRTQHKIVQIDLKAVANGVVVDTRRQPTRPHETFAIEAVALGNFSQFRGGVARMATPATANVNSELMRARREPAFERP